MQNVTTSLASITNGKAIPLVGYVQALPPDESEETLVAEGGEPKHAGPCMFRLGSTGRFTMKELEGRLSVWGNTSRRERSPQHPLQMFMIRLVRLSSSRHCRS